MDVSIWNVWWVCYVLGFVFNVIVDWMLHTCACECLLWFVELCFVLIVAVWFLCLDLR